MIAIEGDSDSYHATLNGIRQRGAYLWFANGFDQSIYLLPEDGSPTSTLLLLITDLYGCDARGGTYTIEETGQSGTYTMTR
jgi:hypothetical protein